MTGITFPEENPPMAGFFYGGNAINACIARSRHLLFLNHPREGLK
jgi:hypothetical protein